MQYESLEPQQLVVELRPGCGVAIGQVQTRDRQPAYLRFQIATVDVVGIARQASARLDRQAGAREDRHAIPALLAVPNRFVAKRTKFLLREALLR